MAFAAVSCLMETLEDLLRFTFLALEINSLQIDIEGKQPEDNYIRNLVESVAATKWIPWGRMRRKYLLHAPARPSKRIFTFRVVLRRGDSIYSLRKSLYFLNVRAIEMSKVFQDLCFLLGFLKELSSVCDDHEKVQCLERSLTDLAYRIEDIIEESVFDRSINSKAFNLIDGVLNVDAKTVIGEVPFMTEVLKMFDKSSSGPQLHLRQILREIHLIKEEVRKIYDDASIFTVDTQLGQSSGIADSLQHVPTKKDEVFDMDDGFLSVLDRVIRVPSRLEMVAIVGMGGIGKTTLAQRVFEYPLTCHHFYVRAWVTASQVYRVRDILIGLLRCIDRITDEIYGKSNGQLAEDLYRSLKGNRFLIVLDNIWSTKAWDGVKRCFPDDKNGSRIVLTTRLKKVADYVNPNQSHHYVSLLDVDQSWKLLQQKVFGEVPCPLELEDVGRRIARKCQGLPLAIVVIAGILCKIMGTCDCWEGIAKSVSSAVISDPEQCVEVLALSYNHLPAHLKACFLYLGSFPEDCEIEVQKLMSLWIAEGFLDKKLFLDLDDLEGSLLPRKNAKLLKILPRECIKYLGKYWNKRHSHRQKQDNRFHYPLTGSISSLELQAEAYLEDLIDRNLVLVGKRSFSGKIKTCRLHDLVHDLCLREAWKENFMQVMGRDSEAFPACMINCRRLCLHSNCWGNLQSVPPMPLVRSFLCFSLGFGSMPDTTFFQLGFKLLRVLDIVFLPFQHFPVQILQLVHLRYLAFTATYELPISISELRNLRTLIIHGPWIRNEFGENPILLFEYWDMPWLRHLHTTVACYLRNPFIAKKDLRSPFRPEYLQSLSTITFSSCSKEVFSLMPRLKKLVIFESEEDYRSDASSKWLSSLVRLAELKALKCSFYAQNGSLRNNLRWLLPSSLKKLSVSWSNLPWQDMTPIAEIPNLEVLKLKNYAFKGPEWEPSTEGFRRLKHLLVENHDLVHLEATRIHFPCLEHLALRSCKSLEEIPFGIAEIPTLQLIELHYCSESAENSAKEIQEQIDGLNVDIRSDRS